MKFGFFDDQNKEYVLQHPELHFRGSTIWEAKTFSL